MSNLKQLIQAIKQKKELQNISDNFVKEEILNYFKKNPSNILEKKLNPKAAEYKVIVKHVRANLRIVYGLFRTSIGIEMREHLVNHLVNNPKREEIIAEILKTHSSTKERLPFYPELYQKIWKITRKPKKIIDLGSGINPFSILLMKLRKLKYYAYDLSKSEIALLNKFFKIINISGKAEVKNILHLSKLPAADVCFLFKMTDVLDKGKGHRATEAVIGNVPAKYVVVSFPTLTMSGKRMNFPRRKWIELMCKRLGYSYERLEFSSEIFYVIRKLKI